MYLPHNLDFRGRAYPIPPHLNHIGDDLSRGLLMFGEAKPLGESGLRWLKIHLANLYGYDKGNFEERVNFVTEHLDDIYDSAENPLDVRLAILVLSVTLIPLYNRADAGGRRQMTLGNALLLALIFVQLWSLQSPLNISRPYQFIRMGRATDYNTMLP
jgi:hypothetical protein